MLKIGLDLHGVLDNKPEFFSNLTNILKSKVEIHIISGGTLQEILKFCKKYNIHFDYMFSIPDYHTIIGTDVLYDKEGNIFMDDKIWDSTKGVYCEENDIDIMIDDTLRYKNYMPKNTFFFHYEENKSLHFC